MSVDEAREKFEAEQLLKKLVVIAHDGDAYQVNLVQGDDDWDLIAVEPHLAGAEFVQRAVCRFMAKQAQGQSSEIEKLTQELAAIDEGFARRPALADCKTRYDKAVKACHTAARVEAAEVALKAVQNLVDSEHGGRFMYVRVDHKPITNGDQDIIDRAYILMDAALKNGTR